MSADRRKTPPRGEERPSDEELYVPPPRIPKLPAAFVGRRRFALPEPEPEPEPEDPIAKAREWGESEYVASEEEEPPPDEVQYVVEEPREPLDRLQSSGYVIDVAEEVAVDEEPTDDSLPGMPRMRVAGSTSEEAGLELPRPQDHDWPSETPPHSNHARGADDSLVERSLANSTPAFDSFVDPSPNDEALGHTLAPKRSLGRVAPPRSEPRPSLADAGRFRVPDRPEGPRGVKSSLTRLPAENLERREAAGARPPEVAEVEIEDEEATHIYAPGSIPVEEAPPPPPAPFEQSVAPLEFDVEPAAASAFPWTPPPPSMGPSLTALAGLGCLVGFVLLATVGAVGAYVWTTLN